MQQWHIEGVREYGGPRSRCVVRWRWRLVGPGGKILSRSAKRFDNVAQCISDARKHGYCADPR